MTGAHSLYPLAAMHLHVVDSAALVQTLQESQISCSWEVGRLLVHHGMRDELPIVIVESTGEAAHLVWYDEGDRV